MSVTDDLLHAAAFAGIIAALVVLLAAGLRLGMPRRPRHRLLLRAGLVAVAGILAFLANVAAYRNDVHLDVTREAAFTPSRESERVVRSLTQDVELVYFYQRNNAAALATKTMVELLGRLNQHLKVRTIDPDQNPATASRLGVRIYNAALIISGDRRLEVVTTDDREIALAILRATRLGEKVICFASGHGEYDIDNFEFHTHFEGTHSHSHDSSGLAVIQMQMHGIGRLRRALDKLGLTSRKVVLATGQDVPSDCAALVEANPRTPFGPREPKLMAAYLARGGSMMLLVEPDFPVDESLAAMLSRVGVGYGDGVIVDPTDHYFTDEQMVAVTRYARHAATRTLALSFFPGARPLRLVEASGITTTALATSSPSSYVIDRRFGPSEEADREDFARPILVAAEGRLGDRADLPPFRMVAAGDADFASNSFFPYMSNADLVLGMLAWLIREEKAPAMKPVVEVLPTVTLTGREVKAIFIVTVLAIPGGIAALGGLVWWRRRR